MLQVPQAKLAVYALEYLLSSSGRLSISGAVLSHEQMHKLLTGGILTKGFFELNLVRYMREQHGRVVTSEHFGLVRRRPPL
jgi:hypothetical protein